MSIEFRRDGPWDLPDGWVWARLGQLGRWTGGGTPSKANAAFWANGTIPWVSPKDMKVDVVGDTEDFITPDALANSATKLVRENSILMVVRSGILKHTFPVALSDRDVTINQDLRALSPLDGIDARYLAFVLRRLQRKILDECSKDGTTVASVEPALLEQVRVPIPPTDEQRRIVGRIDDLFTEITDGETALARAFDGIDTWRRALLKAAVTGELTRKWREQNTLNETATELLSLLHSGRANNSRKRTDQSEELEPIELPQIPETWAWAVVGDVVESMEYGTSEKCDADELGLPVLRMGNIQEGEVSMTSLKYLALTEAKTAPLLSAGDVLFNRTNSEELVGKSAVVPLLGRPTSFASYLIRLKARVSPEFLVAWINSGFGRAWVRKNKSQQVGQANLSGGKLKWMPFPLPPTSEQSEIVRCLAEANDFGKEQQRDLALAQDGIVGVRQSILRAAFEGRLVEQHTRDEPAEKLIARLNDVSVNPQVARNRRRKSVRPSMDLKEASEGA